MSLSGCSKRLDYEASAGWTTHGTWRAPFSLSQGVATPHEGSSVGRRQEAVKIGSLSCHLPTA
jgi:hypothetical protein